jgi:hypothetical protein
MSNFDRQEAFNRAVAGLWAQKAFSMNAMSELDPDDDYMACAYRGLNGTKCAVGYLIPDDRYDAAFENQIPNANEGRVRNAIDPALGEIGHDDADFLGAMQRDLHDSLHSDLDGEWDDDAFREAVSYFARRFDLKVDVNL